ncbi:cytochrome P450 3A9 [Colletotrichum lupini]|uniref:Cytochrome P450 3A9 n=1 Tax=Colletotrichum lupini TaxID=145971 RepID=A0A9Q8T7T3_9PEZI|nr:cytochrome P450 3A9 [Colletotrichum lupini]UQC90732.1 cytochrome P450 3A9 [Colletotrichum lupini]
MASAYILAVYFLVVVLAGLQLKQKIKALKSPLRKLPGPWYAPLTTLHLRYLFSTGTIWKLVERSHNKYGPIIRLGPRQVWISDKEAMKQILVKTDLPKVAMYAEISRDKFSPGLFGEIRQEPHRRLKRFLFPAFTVNYIDNLEMFFKSTVRDVLNKYQTQINEDAVHYAKKGIEVDLMDDLHNVALDIRNVLIPSVLTCTKTVYVKKFFRALGIDLQFDWPAEMITAIDAVVQRRKRTPDVERRDLLQHLIEEGKKPDTGTSMSVRDIVDQMAEILLAGSETTSGTIGCLFLELARNPDVRAKLFASLPSKGFNEEIVTRKSVRNEENYEYLEACIKENLRLHPIASEMGRRTGNQWINLCGYDLPPHTVVSASYRDLHRNEAFWPQAVRFWPERWLSEDKRDGAPAPDMDAYYPFSGGKHSCIGINFAWAEMRMVAANLLQRFDVLEVPDQDIDFRQYITMQFATGHWKVVLKPRN